MKVRIFTDGACSENPGPGGWACVFNTEDKCKTFSGNEQMTTNNRMELKAVIESFKKAIHMKHADETDFELYSDCGKSLHTIGIGQGPWEST